MPRYANIDQRPPFTYASLIRQVSRGEGEKGGRERGIEGGGERVKC